MVRWLALVVCVGAACAGRQQVAVDQRGWAERMQDARIHEHRAIEHESEARRVSQEHYGRYRYECGDLVLNDNLNSGGRQLTHFMPCVDNQLDVVRRHLAAARRERAAARYDRASAQAMTRREQQACGGLPPTERSQSVFTRRDRIAAILPVREGDDLRGVRVVFTPNAGLSVPQVRRDIACRQAQWAIFGESSEILRGDPTLVHDARVLIGERAGHIEVVVLSDAPRQARLALARARGQLGSGGPQTANR
jgi:hypothetical protein